MAFYYFNFNKKYYIIKSEKHLQLFLKRGSDTAVYLFSLRNF